MKIQSILNVASIVTLGLSTILLGCGELPAEVHSVGDKPQLELTAEMAKSLTVDSRVQAEGIVEEQAALDSVSSASWFSLSPKSVIWKKRGRLKSKINILGRVAQDRLWKAFLADPEASEHDTWAVRLSDCTSGLCMGITTVEVPVTCRRRGRPERVSVRCHGRVRTPDFEFSVAFRSNGGPQPSVLKVSYKGPMSYQFSPGDFRGRLAIESLEYECGDECSERLVLPFVGERGGPQRARFSVVLPETE